MASEALPENKLEESNSKTSAVNARSRPHSGLSQRGRIQGERLNNFFRIWWFELLCVLLMFLSFFAIILTLALHQDQPLPQWPFSVSINALLSIYGTVLKGSMVLIVAEGLSQVKWSWFYNDRNPLNDVELFDSATRGPKGALDLLWAFRRRFRQSVFPVLGAVLTLIAIVIDPFTQQIVRYYGCPIISDQGAPATISVVHDYKPTGRINAYGVAGPAMQAAVFAGLFGSTISDAPFNCPTGDCDFHNPYYSTAVCSRCDDITSTLIITKKKTISKWTGLSGFDWKYSLPHSGLFLEINVDFQASGTVIAAESIEDNSTITPDSIDMELIRYTMPTYHAVQPSAWSEYNKTIGAARCGIYPCINKYNASVRAGTLKEWLLASVPLVNSILKTNDTKAGTWIPMPTARISCLSKKEKEVLSSIGYDLHTSNGWLILGSILNSSSDFIPAISPRFPNINKQCLYHFDGWAWGTLGDILSLGGDVAEHSSPGFFGGHVMHMSDNPPQGPIQLLPLYNEGNVSLASLRDKFQHIASSLTSYIRRTSAPENSIQQPIGTVHDKGTCVGVRWPWLVLPLSLLLLTILFFFTILYRSKGRYLWKSSSLALLFHGLDHETRTKYGEAATSEEMAAASKNMLVRLQQTSEGVRFSEAAPL